MPQVVIVDPDGGVVADLEVPSVKLDGIDLDHDGVLTIQVGEPASDPLEGFQRIAGEQGWSPDSELAVLTSLVEILGLGSVLAAHAQQIQAIENTGSLGAP
jgi:hypothetical protein